jgi:hypothetical protein
MLRPEHKAAIARALIECRAVRQFDDLQKILSPLPFAGEISYDATPYYRLLKAVDFYERRRFGLEMLVDAVMWGEGLTEAFLAACDVLQESMPWGVSWNLVFELKKLLEEVPLDDERIAEVLSAVHLRDAIPEDDFGTGLLSRCLYEFADRLNSPLGIFVNALLGYSGEKRNDLEDWLRRAAIPAPRHHQPAPAISGSAPVLVIKIYRDANTEDFHIGGWCCHHKTSPLPNLEIPFARAALDEGLAICWKETRLLLEGDAEAQQKLVVEIFLPEELLVDGTMKLDRLEVKFGRRSKSRIGEAAAVVVRSLNRVYDPELRQDTWGAWNEKWKARPAPPMPFVGNHLYWVCNDAELKSDHFKTLRQDKLVFIALTQVPPGDAGIDIIAGIIDAGTPIAMWRREKSEEAEADRIELLDLLCEHYSDELPRLVLSRRARPETQDSLWRHLVLMWDDPTRLPPDLTN